MKLTGKIVILCCSLSLIAACKKNEESMSAQKRLLTSGKWQQSAGTATVNYMGSDTTIDTYNTMDECDKDDFILFATDGTGTIDENTNKCTSDQQVESFTWVLLSNETKLALIDSNPDTLDIEELTSTQMKLKQIKPNSSGAPVTAILTFKNIR